MELAEAIDARIALLRIKDRVSEMQAKQRCGFSEAVHTAVTEVRSLEQNSVFYISFIYDYRLANGKRYITPTSHDVEEALRDRELLLQLGDAKKKDNPNLRKAYEEMNKRAQETRSRFSALSLQRADDLLAECLRWNSALAVGT